MTYPNFELIEYIFKDSIKKKTNIFENVKFSKIKFDTFLQTWADTATGFNYEPYCAGQAFTDEYTTVIELNGYVLSDEVERRFIVSENSVYGVFFGNRIAYLCINPSDRFFEDLQKRNMLSQKEAINTYGSRVQIT